MGMSLGRPLDVFQESSTTQVGYVRVRAFKPLAQYMDYIEQQAHAQALGQQLLHLTLFERETLAVFQGRGRGGAWLVVEDRHFPEGIPHLALGDEVVLVLDGNGTTQDNEHVAAQHALVEDGLPFTELEDFALMQNFGHLFGFEILEDVYLLRVATILLDLVLVKMVVAHGSSSW